MRNLKLKNIILVLVVVLLGATLFYTNKQYGFFSYKDPVDEIYKSCLKKMEDNSCSVMNGPPIETLPEDSQSVLIAGFGEMDFKLYEGLRQNPLFMCQNIRTACRKDSNETLCRFGQLLY